MLTWLKPCAFGIECEWPSLLLWFVFSMPGLLHAATYLFLAVRTRVAMVVLSLLAVPAFTSSAMLIYPISKTAETEYLTLGLTLCVLNAGLLGLAAAARMAGRGVKTRAMSFLPRYALAAGAIALGCYLRIAGV